MVCNNWLNGASKEQWLLSKALHTINDLRDLQKITESPSRAMPMLGEGTWKSYSKRIRKSYQWHSKLYLGYFDLQADEQFRHFFLILFVLLYQFFSLLRSFYCISKFDSNLIFFDKFQNFGLNETLDYQVYFVIVYFYKLSDFQKKGLRASCLTFRYWAVMGEKLTLHTEYMGHGWSPGG